MDYTRPPPDTRVFAGFALNTLRGALRRPDGSEITLRPKTFQLLARLTAERGQVVSRTTLLDAVWSDVTVTDESLTQAIGELRRILGQEGAGLIRTLARRGYMLDAPDAPQSSVPARARSAHDEARALVRQAWEVVSDGNETPATWLAQRNLLRRAIETDPELPRAWSALALTHAKAVADGRSIDPEGDLRTAREAVERALDLAPADSETWAALGAVLRQDASRIEEARAAYERAVTLDPGAHPSRANLGWMLVLLGRAAEAEVHVRASIVASPHHRFREVWDFMLGMIDLLLHRLDHGAATLGRIVGHRSAGLDIDRVTLMFAAALELEGHHAEAVQFVREICNRDPGLTRERLAAPLWPSSSAVFLAQQARIVAALGRATMP